MKSTRHAYLLTLSCLLIVSANARADMGPPPPPSPDFAHSPPLANAAAGLGLAALAIFGGLWGVRNPLAGVGVFLAVPGALLATLGGTVLADGSVGGLICLLPGLVGFGLGIWLLARKAAFTGRSLAYLTAAVMGVGVLAAGIVNIHWEWPVRASEHFRHPTSGTFNTTPAQTKPTNSAVQTKPISPE
ncbi:MAG: hypothetical protein ACJ8F7_08305 [Gemmataceae bacterium]